MPHFWLPFSSVRLPPDETPLATPRCLSGVEDRDARSCIEPGRSKMCKVDLSDVTAMYLLEGEMARSKITAASIPRRSSAMHA